jgi:hypothetical protein
VSGSPVSGSPFSAFPISGSPVSGAPLAGAAAEVSGHRPHGEEDDDPSYGPVLGLTAGWYAIPAVFYLIWLLTLKGDRQGVVARQFVGHLGWLFAAIVLSLAIAGVLRWAPTGWRALTISFAATVIGAGAMTIMHSIGT